MNKRERRQLAGWKPWVNWMPKPLMLTVCVFYIPIAILYFTGKGVIDGVKTVAKLFIEVQRYW